MTEQNIIGRRPILGAMAALTASSLVPKSATAAQKALPKLDPNDPKDAALIYRKLAWATDDRMGFWWMRGTRYGIVDNTPTPFWEMHVGTLFKVRDIAPGEYEVTNLSISFYTDLKTGEFLKKIVNPLTGKEVDIAYYPPNPPKPAKVRYNETGRADPPARTGPGNIEIGPAWIVGDQVWVRGDRSTAHPATETARATKVNDMPTYFGSLRDVADPAVKMPLAGEMFSDINNWSGYLGMEDRPGTWYSRCIAFKVAAYDDMPEIWRKLMLQEHPDIAKDPAKALMG
jgi:hypothetical protein